MVGLDGTVSLFAGAIVLGLIHGAEPGHGWPVAAAYALDRQRTWFHGFAASALLGLGHLVSSIAVVAVFFLAKAYFDLTQVNEPIRVFGEFYIGGPVSLVAGVLLVGLGVREYRHGHSHSHGGLGGGAATLEHDGQGHDGQGHDGQGHDDHGHSQDEHSHGDHDHSHADHDHSYGDHDHSHTDRDHTTDGHDHAHVSHEDVDEAGLWGIVTTAFVLGFAHEEEFEIIGLCLGSTYCLELMLVYAAAVLVALVALTLLLVAGFERYGERVEGLAAYLPTISAVVLVALGIGFVLGLV